MSLRRPVQHIAFGMSFLRSQISIDDLVLQVSFATFRWKKTNVEMGDWGWMTLRMQLAVLTSKVTVQETYHLHVCRGYCGRPMCVCACARAHILTDLETFSRFAPACTCVAVCCRVLQCLLQCAAACAHRPRHIFPESRPHACVTVCCNLLQCALQCALVW